MFLRLFVFIFISMPLFAGVRGSLIRDFQGRFLFCVGDPQSEDTGALMTVYPDGRVLPLYQSRKERGDLLLDLDQTGRVFVAETRDYKRWGEWEVTIWEPKEDGERRTLWPTWRKRDNLAAFVSDGDGGFYWSHNAMVFHRDKFNKSHIVSGMKQSFDKDGLKNGEGLTSVRDLEMGPKGQLFILDGDALYGLASENSLKRLWHEPNTNARDLATTSDGRSWVVGRQGLIRISPGGEAAHVFKSQALWQLLAVATYKNRVFLLEHRDKGVRISEWKGQNAADLLIECVIEE